MSYTIYYHFGRYEVVEILRETNSTITAKSMKDLRTIVAPKVRFFGSYETESDAKRGMKGAEQINRGYTKLMQNAEKRLSDLRSERNRELLNAFRSL